MGTNTFKLQVAGITETTSIEVVEDVTFTVQFERKKDYDGEFGFDFMRDNYNTISQNYEELKKEYKDAQINGAEYFVPYLSMFPKQGGVILNLKLDIIEGKARKDDVIKLPAKDGIKFVPNKVSLKDLQKEHEELEKEKAKGYDGDVSKINRTEVKVICENELSQDTSIELLDKNDQPVGEIIVVKNDELLTLPIQFVKVKGNEPDNTYNDKTFKTFNPDLIEKELKEKSLNQALIKVERNGISEIILDIEDLIEKDIIKRSGGNIPRFYEEDSRYKNYLDKQFKKEQPNFKGIVYFLSSITQDGQQGGHGSVYPKKSNSVVVVPGQVQNNSKVTFIHEAGHVLGLLHSFKDPHTTNFKKRIESNNKKIEKYQKETKDVKIRIGGDIMTKEQYINLLKERNIELESIISSNLFKFKQSGTDNFMDYYNHSPNSFNKWQWNIIQNEVKQYHGK